MKKTGVQERLIKTASELFYFQGYNQTGINQLLAESGVAKASMYQHFRSKEDIAVAYLKNRHILWMGNLNTFVERENNKHGKIVACFDYIIEWLIEVNFRGCGWQNIIADLPKNHHKIEEQAVFHKNEFREWIHNVLKEENGYTHKIAKELGDEILILLEGAIILSQIHSKDWPIQVAKKACIKLLASTLA